jgi:hypothetical protein
MNEISLLDKVKLNSKGLTFYKLIKNREMAKQRIFTVVGFYKYDKNILRLKAEKGYLIYCPKDHLEKVNKNNESENL